ncbi:recombinase family protein [Thermodesulfobacteriota bacterium]
MKAIGYCRVSSQEQIEGTSLNYQKEQIETYAKLKKIEIIEIFIDAAISGGTPLAKRPEGNRALQALEEGRADSIIITKLDRGFRSASDCLFNVENWEEKGIGLHILNLGGQSIDTSTPTGKFFITVMAGAAELERNLIKERCNEGRKKRKAEGKRIGEVPFGYSLADDGKMLVENNIEQKALNIIWDLHGQGYTLREIARELNRREIASKKGKTWNHSSVHKILKRAA